jgi:hypothetical protein
VDIKWNGLYTLSEIWELEWKSHIAENVEAQKQLRLTTMETDNFEEKEDLRTSLFFDKEDTQSMSDITDVKKIHTSSPLGSLGRKIGHELD